MNLARMEIHGAENPFARGLRDVIAKARRRALRDAFSFVNASVQNNRYTRITVTLFDRDDR